MASPSHLAQLFKGLVSKGQTNILVTEVYLYWKETEDSYWSYCTNTFHTSSVMFITIQVVRYKYTFLLAINGKSPKVIWSNQHWVTNHFFSEDLHLINPNFISQHILVLIILLFLGIISIMLIASQIKWIVIEQALKITMLCLISRATIMQ